MTTLATVLDQAARTFKSENDMAEALEAVGFASSPLWFRLEKVSCESCGNMKEPSQMHRNGGMHPVCRACEAGRVDTFSGSAYRGF